MTAVSIEVHGKRHNVSAAPMEPLSKVVITALSAAGVKAEPAACRLLHGKRQLDLQLPLRLANLPSGAKLHLITGQEPKTGWGSASSARAPTTSAPLRHPPVSPSTPDRHPTDSTLPSAVPAGVSAPAGAPQHPAHTPSLSQSVGVHQAPIRRPQSPIGATDATSFRWTEDAVSQASAQTPHQTPQIATTGGNGHGDTDTSFTAAPLDRRVDTSDAARDGQLAADTSVKNDDRSQGSNGAEGTGSALQQRTELHRLLGREAFVFSRQAALEAAAAVSRNAGRDEDPPDDFFDFTAEDYARVARGWGSNMVRKDGDAPLMTAKLRREAADAAAARADPIPIRIAFANEMLLQGTFAASEPIANLWAFARAAVEPGADLSLYVAPPKVVLKDLKQTLFAAGLAPAAVVYASSASGQSPPQLSSRIIQLQGIPPLPSLGARRGNATGKDTAPGSSSGPESPGLVDADSSRSQQRPSAASQTKLPRWLKGRTFGQ